MDLTYPGVDQAFLFVLTVFCMIYSKTQLKPYSFNFRNQFCTIVCYLFVFKYHKCTVCVLIYTDIVVQTLDTAIIGVPVVVN